MRRCTELGCLRRWHWLDGTTPTELGFHPWYHTGNHPSIAEDHPLEFRDTAFYGDYKYGLILVRSVYLGNSRYVMRAVWLSGTSRRFHRAFICEKGLWFVNCQLIYLFTFDPICFKVKVYYKSRRTFVVADGPLIWCGWYLTRGVGATSKVRGVENIGSRLRCSSTFFTSLYCQIIMKKNRK